MIIDKGGKIPNKFRHLFVLLLIAMFSAERLQTARAADEQLDITFGNSGKVLTDFTGSTDIAFAVVLQPDGKIIAGGQVANTSTNGTDFGLARYKADGSLDQAFGVNGKVLTDIGGLGDFILALALQADGKIVACGQSFTANNFDFSLARYNPNGTLDLMFGTNGKVLTDFANNEDAATAVGIQADGKIVVAGYTADSNFDLDFALVRYNPDGSLDHTFGTGGRVTTDFFQSDDQGFALGIQADGKLVIGGAATNPDTTKSEFALARFNGDGSPDAAFGSGGKTTTEFEEAGQISSLALAPDGSLIAAGGVFAGDETNRPTHGEVTRDFALAKYLGDGSLDLSFGKSGTVVTDFSGEDDEVHSVNLQPDGKIVAVGSTVTGHRAISQIPNSFSQISNLKSEVSHNPARQVDRQAVNRPADGDLDPSAFALARYRADGSLDPSFGGDGKVLATLAADINIAFASSIQSDGRILVAGRAGDFDNPDFGLARFLAADFDLCLQDDINGNLLRLNSATGEYQYQNCSKAVILAGRGVISLSGCKLTLTDSGPDPKRPDRKVQASVNICSKTAAATITTFSQASRSEINDRNIADNRCSCSR
jgi:uncharacterized delta-60 repeat protein